MTAEACTICHSAGNLADQTALHAAASAGVLTRYTATITAVTIPNAATTGGTPTIRYTVTAPTMTR
jgi:hypothetical protein